MTFSTAPSPPRRAARQSRLLTIMELPSWMRDNDFLHGAYRPPHSSLRVVFVSAFFTLHNDTINIWTHALGALFFLCLGAYILRPATSTHRYVSRLAAACSQRAALTTADLYAHIKSVRVSNLCARQEHQQPSVLHHHALSALLNSHRVGLLPLIVSAVLCLLFSALYHAFWVHSPRALRLLAKLDFLGISLLISGHAMSGVYYAFYCTPRIAHAYYALVTLAELATVPCIFARSFSKPAARPFRVFVFTALASTVLLPLLHSVWLHTAALYELAVGVGSAVTSLFIYALGALFYVSRFPECCRAGKHDRFFASHQLLHVAVLLGVACHLFGCWTLMEYRIDVGCSVGAVMMHNNNKL